METTSTLNKILPFLDEIGISVIEKSLSDDTFLPGLELGPGCVYIDKTKLKYPGDLLHEAGHLAVTTPELRQLAGTPEQPHDWPDGGEEIVSILWSYAAAKQIDLPVEVLFHPDGYKGQSDWIKQQFEEQNYVGIPLLEWMGLTKAPKDGITDDDQTYPKMIRWMRE